MNQIDGDEAMSDTWIVVRADLLRSVEVAFIANATGLTRHAVVGKLVDLWCWATDESDDGTLAIGLDLLCSATGLSHCFLDAVFSVGWLFFRPQENSQENSGENASGQENSPTAVFSGAVVFSDWDRWLSIDAKLRLANELCCFLSAERTAKKQLWGEGGRASNSLNSAQSNTLESALNGNSALNEDESHAQRVGSTREEKNSEKTAEKTARKQDADGEREREFLTRWNGLEGVIRVRPIKGELKLTSKRRIAFRARLGGSEWWALAMESLGKFPLKCFNDPGGWRPTLDWFLRPDTVVSILEGKYDWTRTVGRNASVACGPGQRHASERQRECF